MKQFIYDAAVEFVHETLAFPKLGAQSIGQPHLQHRSSTPRITDSCRHPPPRPREKANQLRKHRPQRPQRRCRRRSRRPARTARLRRRELVHATADSAAQIARDAIVRKAAPAGPHVSILSWNVNGLRALDGKGILERLVATHKPDVLVLQETKLQDVHVPALQARLLPEYTSHWTCSVAQKARLKVGCRCVVTRPGLCGIGCICAQGLRHAARRGDVRHRPQQA